MTSDVHTEQQPPLRVAIVGSGPSGFYAAGHLLSQAGRPIEVDVFERLPTPWGLVRGGVAPDHPKIKSVTRMYEKTARKEGFRFFGNVEVGTDISHDELASWYDAVIYASGTSGDKKSGIAGEDLPGSLSATEFVGWYNAHPDFKDLDPDLSVSRAVVIGNGNVAIDCARMLTLSHDELAVTDIADHALELLVDSSIEEILVLGRRGPEQAAFTNPELLELGELADADVIVDPADLLIPEDLQEDELDATARKNVEILREYAERLPSGKRKRVVLRFLASPVELLGDGRVEQVRVVRNELVRDEAGGLRARPTETEEIIEAGLVLRAIGYTGFAIPGVPFDERKGLIPNDGDGRVIGPDGDVVPGLYTAGWIKRGPSGVIGTNKKCAQDTVNAVLADFAGHESTPKVDTEDVASVLRARVPGLVDYAGWELIDAHEKGRGEPQGRPRVKLTLVDEMVRIAAEQEPAAH